MIADERKLELWLESEEHRIGDDWAREVAAVAADAATKIRAISARRDRRMDTLYDEAETRRRRREGKRND